jgi:hypothetical protein
VVCAPVTIRHKKKGISGKGLIYRLFRKHPDSSSVNAPIGINPARLLQADYRYPGININRNLAEQRNMSDPETIPAGAGPADRITLQYTGFLKSRYLIERTRAAEALGESGSREAVQPLIDALEDPFVDVQWLAARSLGKLKDERAVGPLVRLLTSPDKWTRLGAVLALREIGQERAVLPLMALLHDPDRRVREAVVLALGDLGDGAAADKMTDALNDPDEKVKTAARVAIERIQKRVTAPADTP